ncbi:MAG: DUF29 domain-containing protein [Limnoraphis robusta]|nr:DUF29 domain-containing protein [Limnoraphis robusta]MEA5501354.1 DUF29 domain-containing protein [Limnoraphis robusta BA-68 BA1]MEA5519062.1 DUF29 domain-containing protein [Limnoraphis robusta CCNP1315]MEA5540614.1 DUF29 domain-containing protein [Limnoraphis robusta Tam1]MEA5544324.1 DUF29 domain-containing protein [Limnoraphis robusta CCNP1324]
MMKTQPDWHNLAASSEYQTAIIIQKLLQEKKWMEADQGLGVLIESMGKSKKLALKSQLIRLMSHVIKWKCQPERRSSSWAVTILSARNEIEDIQEEIPSLNRNYLESVWEQSFNKAVKQAEIEMNKKCDLTLLSWEEVFEQEYTLLNPNE